MSSWIDARRKQTHELKILMELFSNLPIRTVAHYFEEMLFYVQSFEKRKKRLIATSLCLLLELENAKI